MVLNIMGSVSQWEREAIGERTRDGMRHKRRRDPRELALDRSFAVSPLWSCSKKHLIVPPNFAVRRGNRTGRKRAVMATRLSHAALANQLPLLPFK
jgi:hypothetical protein